MAAAGGMPESIVRALELVNINGPAPLTSPKPAAPEALRKFRLDQSRALSFTGRTLPALQQIGSF
jgi:hypothetical protein